MKILVFLVLLSTSFFSQAAYTDDGNTLILECQVAVDMMGGEEAKDYWKAPICAAYITGMTDMALVYSFAKPKDKKFFCIPEEVTHEQNIRAVLKYLKDRPQDLHKPKGVLVLLALAEAFPCKV
jgi:membrane glycosyltransferase